MCRKDFSFFAMVTFSLVDICYTPRQLAHHPELASYAEVTFESDD